MRTREWERIIRLASTEAFDKWLATLSPDAAWHRGDICACPLHDFIEWASGHDLAINSPELSEHWGERETQQWPTPWWMTWLIRSVDNTGEGRRIYLADLKAIFEIGKSRWWDSPLMSPQELQQASL